MAESSVDGDKVNDLPLLKLLHKWMVGIFRAFRNSKLSFSRAKLAMGRGSFEERMYLIRRYDVEVDEEACVGCAACVEIFLVEVHELQDENVTRVRGQCLRNIRKEIRVNG